MPKRPIFSVSDALVASLESLGVRCVFGLPGSQNTELYESLRKSNIRTVLAVSETTAGFMANGWYRASGEPGVFIAIEGPGFAWSVPPLMEARLDSSATLLITGLPPGSDHDYDLQAIGQKSVAEALGATVFDIDEEKLLSTKVYEAWRELTRNGPRPVVLQISERLLSKDWGRVTAGGELPVDSTTVDPIINNAAIALANAKRPVVFAGSGALKYAQKLQRFIESTGTPFFTTPPARGVVPESHPLCLATDLYFQDVGAINEFLGYSDRVVALGCRLSRNSTAGFGLHLAEQKLIHVGTNPDVPNATYPSRWPVQTDVGTFLDMAAQNVASLPFVDQKTWNPTEIEEWQTRLRSQRRLVTTEPIWEGHGECDTLFRKIREGVPNDGIIVTDTGLHQLMVRAHIEIQSPSGLIFPSDFQSMGFGLPAALGAAIAAPERPVAAIVGDGSFLMVGSELVTAKREGVGLPVLVFCDNSLGLIRNQQIESFGSEVSTHIRPIILADYARALGVFYELADDSLAKQIKAALEKSCPTVIEVRLNDSADLNKLRRKAVLKSSLKAAVGPGATRLLNRLKRKS